MLEKIQYFPPPPKKNYIQVKTCGRPSLISTKDDLFLRPHPFPLFPKRAAQWKTEREYVLDADPSDSGNPGAGVSQSAAPPPGPGASDHEEDGDDLPSTVIATTAGVPSPGESLSQTCLTLRFYANSKLRVIWHFMTY